MSTSFLRESVGITSPITHSGRVVYNAKRDYLETRRRKTRRGCVCVYEGDDFGDDECHSIQPYELLFRTKRDYYKKYSPNDTDLSVFSNANGICISHNDARDTEDQGDRIKKMMDGIEFCGVACNRAICTYLFALASLCALLTNRASCVADDPHNNANEEGLACQIGGLQTIYNTGADIIYAGDTVLWDKPWVHAPDHVHRNMPMKRYSPGAPRIKRVFATVRYSDTQLAEALEDVGLETGNVHEKVAKALFGLQRRVIGRAQSTADPGQPFDIMLAHYCA